MGGIPCQCGRQQCLAGHDLVYTKPQHGTAVPIIAHRGVTANRHEDKAQMLMISFPAQFRAKGTRANEALRGRHINW